MREVNGLDLKEVLENEKDFPFLLWGGSMLNEKDRDELLSIVKSIWG